MSEKVEQGFREKLTARGWRPGARTVEVWRDPRTGEWLTFPDAIRAVTSPGT